MRFDLFASACCMGLSLATAAAAQGSASDLRLGVLASAREIELDMSRGDVAALLDRSDFAIEQEGDLPDGQTRFLLAVPALDNCLPRGAPLICPSIRVHLRNDPQRGHRVFRIEAFQPLPGDMSVAEVFRQVAAAMGPPLQTSIWSESLQSGDASVWRQRWRDDISDGPLTEIMATQRSANNAVGANPLANPHEAASGVGYIRADPDVSGAVTSIRRRFSAAPAAP